MKHNPIFVITRSLFLLLSGRAYFPKERLGEMIIREDGQTFTVFRQVLMKTKTGEAENPDGIFRVWFKTKASTRETIRLSYLTLFGFMGLPGFRSKLWLYNEETGEFGGIYEWDTIEDAYYYDKSYAMKFSQWRSLPGEFRTDVFSQTDLRASVHRRQKTAVHG